MTTNPASVSVLGLGAMGRALATALLASGHRTTVWNRSPGRADALVAAGATEAPTVAAAAEAGDLVIICVLHRDAVEEILRAIEAAGLHDLAVVNMTSMTPEDAGAVASNVHGRGGRYLDGAIMVPTPLIGTADAHVLYSGDRDVFAAHQHTLAAFGGTVEMLGDEAGLAATFDLGMLDVFFNGMATFLHAAALVGADGVSATAFVPYARRMLSLLDLTVAELAANVDSGEHDGAEDNLAMELSALEHINATSTARGVDPTLPAVTLALARAAVEAGHGADSFSRVIDVVRPERQNVQRVAPPGSAVATA